MRGFVESIGNELKDAYPDADDDTIDVVGDRMFWRVEKPQGSADQPVPLSPGVEIGASATNRCNYSSSARSSFSITALTCSRLRSSAGAATILPSRSSTMYFGKPKSPYS